MKTYRHELRTGVAADRLWAAFNDLEHWNLWDKGLEETHWVDRDRRIFSLKPRGGKAVTIRVAAWEEGRLWTDRTTFPLAVLEGEHRFLPLAEGGTDVITIMRIRGPLAALWNKLVVRGIAAGMKEQTEALIERARSVTVGL